jgi:hypothetical protein
MLLRHNGYCWEYCRKLSKEEKMLRGARRSCYRSRMAKYKSLGMNYGACVWYSTWDTVRLYGSCADKY